MNAMSGHVSSPVFLHMVWIFLLVTSLLVFFMGVGLTLRIPAMMRLFDLMNRWVSVRNIVRHLSETEVSVEPLRRPVFLGIVIVAGAAASVFILKDYPLEAFVPLFMGKVPIATAVTLSTMTKSLLVIGNIICLLVGVLMLFFPALLSRIEGVADSWYSVRKQMPPIAKTHVEVDKWVLSHPTVSGIALMVMALGLAVSVLSRI